MTVTQTHPPTGPASPGEPRDPIRIRPFDDASDRPEVFALYARVFGEEAFGRFERRYRWQFFDNPTAQQAASLGWVAERDGVVVGFLGCFPTRMKLGDEETVVYHDCDLIVAPEARRMGLGSRLVQAYDACPSPLSSCLTYAASNGRIRGRLGYRPLHAVPVWYRPVRIERVVKFALENGRVPGLLAAPPLSWACRGLGWVLGLLGGIANGVRRPKASPRYRIEGVEAPGEEFDGLWERTARHVPLAAVRDRRFVQWRFFDDPNWNNVVLVARDRSGTLQGYVALRTADKGDGVTIGRILDIFCQPTATEVIHSLLRGALDRLERDGVSLVSCLALHPDIRRRVRRYFWIKPKRLDNPAWLLWKGRKELAGLVYDETKWHLSQADSDIGFEV